MTKNETIQEWIQLIDLGKIKTVIVKDKDNDYFTHRDNNVYTGDEIVYSYGAFVNSSSNMEIEDIAKRIK